MNLFNLQLLHLALPAPMEKRIASKTLLAWQQADDLTRWVRRRAAERLLRVRQRRVATRQAAMQYIQLTRKRAQAQVTQLFEQTRRDAILQTVQWLGTVQQIEVAIAARLAKQAENWAVEALKSLVTSLDQPAILVQQLQAPLRELQTHGELTLRVHSTQLASLVQRFAAIKHLTVIGDKDLKPLQAVLESPLVVVKLDLEHHLSLLMDQLTNQLALVTAAADNLDSESSDQAHASQLL